MSKIRRKNALSAFIHLTTHKVTHIFPYNYYKQCVIFPHHPNIVLNNFEKIKKGSGH